MHTQYAKGRLYRLIFMKFKCIIFDCDGVLVDSEAISATIFHEMALELGLMMSYDDILDQITGTSMKSNIAFFNDRIEGGVPANFEVEYRRRSYDAFRSYLQPVSGIKDLLKKITVPIGVASSGPVEKIRLNLTITGLIDRFENQIYSSYDIGSWKPDPDIYLYAAAKMGFNPMECAVVEDSTVGIMAALKGNFSVFAYAPPSRRQLFSEMGATVFESMEALEKLLQDS